MATIAGILKAMMPINIIRNNSTAAKKSKGRKFSSLAAHKATFRRGGYRFFPTYVAIARKISPKNAPIAIMARSEASINSVAKSIFSPM
jgi:hypothetical protein